MNTEIQFVPVYADSDDDITIEKSMTLEPLHKSSISLKSMLGDIEQRDRWILGTAVGKKVVPFACVDFQYDPTAVPPSKVTDIVETQETEENKVCTVIHPYLSETQNTVE